MITCPTTTPAPSLQPLCSPVLTEEEVNFLLRGELPRTDKAAETHWHVLEHGDLWPQDCHPFDASPKIIHQ